MDNRIAELRRVLGDDPAVPRWIETVTGQGYRFIAPVEGGA
ncbi:winged helix-turn-helix domain-containing protein [Streptomyces vilmorinianum]|nr:winged helix-turn-helix domain-containing protein [Streptomyces vilmorinianum]